MELGLKGKAVIITGGSKGLGLACARSFLAEGAKVGIISRSAANLQQAVASLQAEGHSVASAAADLVDAAQAEQAVASLEQALGGIDVLVNSAGAAKRYAPETLDPANWKAAMDAKYFTYIHAQEAVLRRMLVRAKAQGYGEKGAAATEVGSIVNLIGMGGKVPGETHIAGGAANAALMLSTAGLAKYYARYGIRINAINPGFTLTERNEQALELDAKRLGISRDEVFARGEVATPLRRYGKPEEIAQVTVFLASRMASYMVGALVSVDGGQNAVL